ncbi:MAG TPA: hypothetical protein VK509_24985, partial [Polyangiales bacterium]|nr:hypothetical protein [Polyangiales bacterium]
MSIASTHGFVFALVASIASLGLGGCGDLGIGERLACNFDFDASERIESEMGVLRGSIDCADVTHCSDNRTLMSGLELELSIDVAGRPPDAISVVTDNPDVLKLDGFTNEEDACRDGTNTRVEGRLRFEGVGEASLIVMNGREEIDRFTWS